MEMSYIISSESYDSIEQKHKKLIENWVVHIMEMALW